MDLNLRNPIKRARDDYEKFIRPKIGTIQMKHIAQLYAKASTGKIKVWRCDVTDSGCIVVTHGYLNGALTTTEKQVLGKNIGKSNETTPFQQACLEAESKMRKKMDEGYTGNKDDLEDQVVRLPMLAHRFQDRSHDICYPAYVQPKLNGIRCLADLEYGYISRKGKEIKTLEHLNADVATLLGEIGKEQTLDGEIFVKGWNFQEITRASKKLRDESQELEFWIFDIADPNKTFEERKNILEKAFKKLGRRIGPYERIGKLVLVPTSNIDNEKEVRAIHKIYTNMDYEGTIIRNKGGQYVFKHRSADLQKFKDFQDEEFRIVGGTEATGNDAGTVVFICTTNSGQRFSVRPKGSRKIRREWLEDLNNIIGKELTVRYQELSEDGIPIFPVGIDIRDYE